VNRLLKISERNKSEMLGLLPSEACSSKLALYFQNFADQTRIKILSALAIQELCVNDLSKILNINQTTISHQLKTLKDQEIVDYTREGKILIYRLKSPLFNEMMEYAASMIWVRLTKSKLVCKITPLWKKCCYILVVDLVRR